ncbi:MAG: VanW family protein [Sebaldella sp.]|nr:VanW family protein [Sebaldella sp.]
MARKVTLLVLGTVLVIFGALFYLSRDTGKMYKNITVSGVDLSGKTKEEALKSVNGIKFENIKLKYENKEYTILADSVDYKINSEETVNSAYSVGRKNGFIKDRLSVLKLIVQGKKKEVPIMYTLDTKALKIELEKISSNIDIEEKNAKITLNGDQISFSNEENGRKLNIEKSMKLIENELKSSEHDPLELVVETVVPSITKEKLSKVDTLLGEFSTTFNSGVQGRSYNIKLSTDAINDVLLEPDQILSFNESTGMRSAKNGYKSAPVIVNGELEQGLGGGVCQVSSTLFNAVALSGLKVVERSNHSIPSSYVGIGRDAVVDFGTLDLKVQNNYKNPVYFSSGVEGNKIIIKVYGNSEDKPGEVKLFSTVNGSVARKTKTVKYGKPSNGRDGIKATTYRVIVDKNGNENKEVLSSSYYPAKARVIVLEPGA